MSTEVRNDPEQQRYEILVEGERAGVLDYEIADGRISLTHTGVDDAYQGQGLASILVRGALDDIRATGDLRVVPLCPYAAGWIEKHPDYAGLTTR